MKHLFLLFALLACLFGRAQDSSTAQRMTLKWAPTGLIVGSLSLQGEYHFSARSSITAKIGVPIKVHRSFDYQEKEADFELKASSFLAGYRRYFSKRRPMHGLYLEPYFKYVHHTAEGEGSGTLEGRAVTMSFLNNYNGFGVGMQLGAQFRIGRRAVIDLFFLGPEINSASNKFLAREVSNGSPWSPTDAEEARQQIIDFLDQFPFIRNKVAVSVDSRNKSVDARFRGALPGFRAGFSLGIAL
ncbi:MAG: DUF3575 domain-containing protein [Chitinophagaceae bacterium]|nr:MAG: DUF3575 domain-containing protein [Chitinophagaceae bacterium]